MRVSALLGKAFSSGCAEPRLNCSSTEALPRLSLWEMAQEVGELLAPNTYSSSPHLRILSGGVWHERVRTRRGTGPHSHRGAMHGTTAVRCVFGISSWGSSSQSAAGSAPPNSGTRPGYISYCQSMWEKYHHLLPFFRVTEKSTMPGPEPNRVSSKNSAVTEELVLSHSHRWCEFITLSTQWGSLGCTPRDPRSDKHHIKCVHNPWWANTLWNFSGASEGSLNPAGKGWCDGVECSQHSISLPAY